MTDVTTETDAVFRNPKQKPTSLNSARNVPVYRYNYVYSSRRLAPAPPPAAKSRHWSFSGAVKAVITLGVVGLVIFGGMHVATARDLSGGQKATAAAAKKPSLAPANIADPNLQQDINSLIAKYSDLEVGVSLVSVADGKTANFGVSDPYVAASVDKLMTATAYLHQVDQGQVTFNQTLEDGQTAGIDLQKLIVQSDNDAWVSLNDYLTHQALKTYATSIGINSYDADANTIAPEDVAQLLYKLYAGKLLNDSSQKLLLSYLKQSNYTQYIMSALPSGVTAYHKAGVLDDRVNDAAIIDNGKTVYVLVIFSKADDGNYDFSEGTQLFHDLTAATTTHLLK